MITVLKYNEDLDRYNNFSCGSVFEIKIENEWKIVRIELGSNGWYLIHDKYFTAKCRNFEGFEIRI